MRKPGGFTLVSALFLLVVLAALGTYMVTVHVVQQATSGAMIRQGRALAAAHSGLEWAVYRALQLNSCVSANFTLTESSLAGFAVNVACTQTTHRVRSADVRYYALRVEVSRGVFGTPEFVSRTLSATVGDAP